MKQKQLYKLSILFFLFFVITLNVQGQCTPPNIVVVDQIPCTPQSIDLNDAIGPGSDPANITFHDNEYDAYLDRFPISSIVTGRRSYWIRAESPSDAKCYKVYRVSINLVYGTDGPHVVCDPYTWRDGNTYRFSNHFATDTIFGGSKDGCDSVVVLDLIVSEDAQTTDIIYSCEPYKWVDGNTYSSSNNTASIMLTNASGCDSLVTLDLMIPEASKDTIRLDTTICFGEELNFNGKTYTKSGIYIDTISNVTITPRDVDYGPSITVKPSKNNNYGWGQPALYYDYNPDGSSKLNVDGTPTYMRLPASFWRGHGNVTNSIVNQLGFWNTTIPSDQWYGSTFTIDVPVTKTYYVAVVGDNSFRFSLDGNILITSDPTEMAKNMKPGSGGAGTLSFTWLHIYPVNLSAGCHTITLEGNNDGGAGMFGGAIFDNTDEELVAATEKSDLNYFFSTENVNKFYPKPPTFSCPPGTDPMGSNLCDECISLQCGDIVEINLKIKTPKIENYKETVCEGETYTLHGFSYDTERIHKDTLRDITGCDSIQFVLDLSFAYPQTGIDKQSVCVSYEWIDGNTYTSSNNTATFIIPNGASNGCDSIVQLDLTILEPATSIDVQSVCDSYEWMDGNTYTASNNTATYTIPNGAANGCDSIIQLDLTIKPLPIISAPNDKDICIGEGVTLTVNNPDGATISWNNGVSDGVQFHPTTLGPTTYTVTAILDNCISTDEVVVDVHPLPVPSFVGDDLQGCDPHTVNFTNTTGSTSTTCLWSFGDGNSDNNSNTTSHTYTSSGFYDVSLTITDEFGCIGTTTKKNYIDVIPMPIADFTADPLIVNSEESEVNFTNESSNASHFTWDFGDGTPIENGFNASHKYTIDGLGSFIVTLIASNDFGCIDTAYLEIMIKEELIYYIPNSFTPDNDGFNEIFQPIFTAGYDPQNFKLLIFNRWGELIFESRNTEIGWDGSYGNKTVKDGIYVWTIEFKEKMTDKKHSNQGFVNIIR